VGAQVIAYKFLGAGRVGIFSGFVWPDPGHWVEAAAVECASGVHACRTSDLPYWAARSLWEVELDGEIHEGRTKVVASRGRLLRPIEAWNDEGREAYVAMCADRAHELAAEAGPAWDATIEPSRLEGPALIGFVAARISEELDGVEGYVRERASQAAWLVDRLGLVA
jgi:hypothetical protein